MAFEKDSNTSEEEPQEVMLKAGRNENEFSIDKIDPNLGADTSQTCESYYEVSPISSKAMRQSFILTHHSSFSEKNFGRNDCIDSVPDYMSFTLLDALGLLFSIGSYLLDIITDITVATLHYLNENYIYFFLTITFVALPTFLMTIISLRWYIVDSSAANSPKVSKCQWFLRLLFLLFQLGPIMRYIDSLIYGFKFRKNNSDLLTARQFYQYMIYEDTDATMLRLFEGFMEAAPQLILQIYILATHTPTTVGNRLVAVQIASTFASLVSLSWSLVSYFRILRMSLPNKRNMAWKGTIVQFLWRFFMIGSRCCCLALFASRFSYYIGVLCFFHWLIMFLWIVSMNTKFCENRFEELFYDSILAVIFIFCYFNPVDRPTRYRYCIYYGIMLFENSLILALWFAYSEPRLYHVFGLVGYYVFFLTGLIFMALYYLRFHPILSPFPASSNTTQSQVIRTNADVVMTNIDLPKTRNTKSDHDFNVIWTTEERLHSNQTDIRIEQTKDA